jgi:hypothetical protein
VVVMLFRILARIKKEKYSYVSQNNERMWVCVCVVSVSFVLYFLIKVSEVKKCFLCLFLKLAGKIWRVTTTQAELHFNSVRFFTSGQSHCLII